MTALEDNIEFVEANPFDQTAALALVDRIQEEWSFPRRQALKYVAVVRRPARQAHYIDQAAAIMRRCSRSARMARDYCVIQAFQYTCQRCVLMFLTGFRSPRVGVELKELPRRFPPGLIVSVGAREFLRVRKRYLRSLRSIAAQWSVPRTQKKAGAK